MTQINGSVHKCHADTGHAATEKKPVVADHAAVLAAIDGYDSELRAINKKVIPSSSGSYATQLTNI